MLHYLQQQLCIYGQRCLWKIGNRTGLPVGQHSVKCGGWRGSEMVHGGPRFIRLKVFHHHTHTRRYSYIEWLGWISCLTCFCQFNGYDVHYCSHSHTAPLLSATVSSFPRATHRLKYHNSQSEIIRLLITRYRDFFTSVFHIYKPRSSEPWLRCRLTL